MSWCFVFLVFTLTITEQTLGGVLRRETEIYIGNEWREFCKNETFCTEPSRYYPAAQIKELLKTWIFEGQEVITLTPRMTDEDFYVQQCKNYIIPDPVYEIVDDAGKIRYVVQSEKYFKQIIVLEKCKTPGMFYGLDYFGGNFHLTCEEKRIDYKFMVLSENQQRFEYISVANGLPVSCYCKMEEHEDY